MPRFCHALISFYSWEELESYAKFSSSKVGEERITETLVSEIIYALCQQKVKLPIRFFHSKDEKSNGNDLEIVVPVGNNESIILPCQAKRLYVERLKDNSKAAYKAIHHVLHKGKPDQHEQICSLINYAEKVEGFPVYLFYNYSESVKISDKYPLKELYGCTLLNAYHVYEEFYKFGEIKPFTFQSIHPPAQPLIWRE